MKIPHLPTRNRVVQTWIFLAAACAALVAFPQPALAVDRIKEANTNNLNLTTSWVGGNVPTSSDVGVWDDTVTGANTTVLGADLSWSGIRIAGTTETGLVRINPGNQLTLGAGGIDLSNSPRNLFLNVTVNADVDQTWDVAAGRTLSHVNISNSVILTGSGNIAKTGAGTLYISDNAGTNDFAGNLTIEEGRLQVVGVAATNTGGNFILEDGVRVENASTAAATVTGINGTRVTHIDGNVTFVGTTGGTTNNTRLVFAADRNTTRAVNLRTNVEINVENPLNANGGGFVTIGGISESGGSHSLTKTGPGMLTLIRNTSSYTGGTFINEGILELGDAGAVNRLPAGNVVINGGTLRMTGAISAQSTGGGTLTLTSGAIDGTSVDTLTAASYTMDSGSVGIALAGGGGLTKNTIGTVNITSANTFTGGTTVNAGTLLVSGTGSINNSSGVTIHSGGNFSYSSSTGLTRNLTLNTGGTFTHNGATNYGGTLTWNGGTLAGTNFSGVSLNVGANKTLSPGNSPGTMTSGNQTWTDGGNYNLQIFDVDLAAGTGFDTIAITGTLDLTGLTAGGFDINLWSLSAIGPDVNGDALNFDNLASGSWQILSTTGGITGFNADNFTINIGSVNGTSGFSNALGGGSFSVSQSGNNLLLEFTPIPEPRVWALAGIGMAAILMRLRRRR